jgi:hypothetical protein
MLLLTPFPSLCPTRLFALLYYPQSSSICLLVAFSVPLGVDLWSLLDPDGPLLV